MIVTSLDLENIQKTMEKSFFAKFFTLQEQIN